LAGLVGCRAIVSKLVPVEEQGAVMSAMSAIYALAPMIGSLIYSKLFEISLHEMPGLPFAGGSIISVLAMFVLVWLDYSMQSQN
jgi:MFS family permease